METSTDLQSHSPHASPPPVPLEEILQRARADNRGPRGWQLHKEGALDELLEVAARASRLSILDIDLSTDFHFVYEVRMPVPRFPQNGELVVGDRAVFHLQYAEAWLTETPAPWAPVGLFWPHDPWHPNMAPALRGAICLGSMNGMLASASPKELLLAAYFAVCLRDVKLDENDPLGVLNAAASAYFRQHPEYLPLTQAGLYDDWHG